MTRSLRLMSILGGLFLVFHAGLARAAGPCDDVPLYGALQTALVAAVGASNGGFGLNMWATAVNRDGVVCAVAFSGSGRGDQ